MQSDNPLENVTVLPHVGSGTIEARNEMARLASINIIGFYKHHKVPNIVNPEALSNKLDTWLHLVRGGVSVAIALLNFISLVKLFCKPK